MTQTTTYNPDGSYSIFSDDGRGNTSTANFSAAGVELSDTWAKADGSSGSDTFDADGSSTGTTAYPDGTSSSYVNDGLGDITTTNFNAGGVKVTDAWSKANGSTGSDTFNADGSSSGMTLNGDGTSSSYVNDGLGDITTTNFNAGGVKVSDAWSQANGSSGSDVFNADGSIASSMLNLGDVSQSVTLGNANITVSAGNGNDSITLGTGTDVVVAGNGNDTITGSGALTATVGNGNDLLQGGSGASVLTAGSGNDTLVAGSGLATLNGGTGTDTFVVNNYNDVVNAQATASNTVLSSANFYAPANSNIQTLQGTGSAAIQLDDDVAGSTVIANSGNDSLATGLGVETLIGGSGVDDFYVGNAADVIIAPAVNNDIEETSTSVTLAPNLRTLISDAASNVNNVTLTGNALNDTLTGGLGNTTLVSGLGVTTLIGRSIHGHDTFVVNNINDVVQVTGYGSLDNVEETSVSATQVSGIGTMIGIGSAAITLTGTHLLEANSGNDTLVASAGGLVTMVGGSGNDTFVVNTGWAQTVQAQATGTNTVLSSDTYTLPANVQILTGTGNAAITLTGNNLNDVITGNAGADVLVAGSGKDTLIAGSGIDTLNGSNNYDTFVVNNVNDVVNALVTGINTIQTSVSYVASNNVKTLTGMGSAALMLSGNSLADVITANSGNDTLVAGSGLATLVGGAGNDTFMVNNAMDVINAGSNAANDKVVSSVGYSLAAGLLNLTGTGNRTQLTGNSGNDLITDNGLMNTLVAGSGNDTLLGNTGGDTLIGGSGNDTFVINSINDTINDQLGSASSNTILTSVNYVAPPNVQNITAVGNANVSLTGSGSNNVNGLPVAANAVITSNTGVDTLIGGVSNNTFVVNNSNDVVQASNAIVIPGSGTPVNTVDTSVNFVTPVNVQNLIGIGSANLILSANNLNDVITSNTGVDTLYGGMGNDTFVINNAMDVVNAMPGTGINSVVTAVSYVMPANVQSLTATGSANLTLTANSANDVITSNSGIDNLVGGIGNDTFVINNPYDSVNAMLYQNGQTKNVNTVITSVNYFAPQNVQNLTATGSANLVLNANANSLNDVVTTNSGIDTIYGGNGSDTFVINNSADIVNASIYQNGQTQNVNTVVTSVNYFAPQNVQNLTATGSANLLLYANSMDDVITSNAGVDTMYGGSGNDTFVVNNSADVINIQAGPASNTVDANVSYVAPTNVQSLIVTGSGALTATANNGGVELVVGGVGADTLVGGQGLDVLEAGSGNNVLTEATGQGALIAGAGNDTMTSGTASTFIAAGLGTDVINLGQGTAVVAYNGGDGKTTIIPSGMAADVLSLGKGIAYSNLSFSKSGNNLILNTGGNSSITFSNWYGGTANQDFVTLQVIEQSAATWSANSTNTLYNQEVEEFNFTQLVGLFNSALAANPSLTSWSLSNSMLTAHLSGSNTSAFGGDLAYYDGMNGNLTGMTLGAAGSALQGSSFGHSTQAIDPWFSVSNGNTKLR